MKNTNFLIKNRKLTFFAQKNAFSKKLSPGIPHPMVPWNHAMEGVS
ncbi:hypothetical protein [Thiosulfatihalobacter marinus]|nr:hypothetical protein [Thiosulfatihalobacter marinus]